jgi:hypothetical protein
MATTSDPYRTLGLDRGASLADVRKAYRRLAKVYHPDSAGEAALPRFLAIQAAYDQILGIDPASGSRGPTGPARPPWDADQERANATHRAYGGRRRSTGRGRPKSDPAGGPSTSGWPGTNTTDGRGPTSNGDAADPRRPPNKATPGSTSYDGADLGPFEPDWGGASWYGTSSGTYWTLNPREYADPRKHGPEYQARARRAAAADAATDGSADPLVGSAPDGLDREDESPRPAPGPGDPSPSATTASWWEATAGGPAQAPVGEAARGPDAADVERDADPPAADSEATAASASTDGSRPAAAGAPRAWRILEGAPPTLIERIARAVLGWAPIALTIGWGVGEASGCARFSSACDPLAGPLAWSLQLLVLVGLILAPTIASVFATGAVVALGVSIPAAIALAGAGANLAADELDPSGARSAVIAVSLIGWAIGALIGMVRWVRRRQASRARPGSTRHEPSPSD